MCFWKAGKKQQQGPQVNAFSSLWMKQKSDHHHNHHQPGMTTRRHPQIVGSLVSLSSQLARSCPLGQHCWLAREMRKLVKQECSDKIRRRSSRVTYQVAIRWNWETLDSFTPTHGDLYQELIRTAWGHGPQRQGDVSQTSLSLLKGLIQILVHRKYNMKR